MGWNFAYGSCYFMFTCNQNLFIWYVTQVPGVDIGLIYGLAVMWVCVCPLLFMGQLVIRCCPWCPQSCHAEKRHEWSSSAIGLEWVTAGDRCHGSDPDLRKSGGGARRPSENTGNTGFGNCGKEKKKRLSMEMENVTLTQLQKVLRRLRNICNKVKKTPGESSRF